MGQVDGQYTLDADPMVLARRVQVLEQAVDGLTAVLVALIRDVRVVCYEADKALCEDRPLQAAELAETAERMSKLYGKVHALSTMMGRSY